MGGDDGDQEPVVDGRTGALIREVAAVHGKGRCGMNDSGRREERAVRAGCFLMRYEQSEATPHSLHYRALTLCPAPGGHGCTRLLASKPHRNSEVGAETEGEEGREGKFCWSPWTKGQH